MRKVVGVGESQCAPPLVAHYSFPLPHKSFAILRDDTVIFA